MSHWAGRRLNRPHVGSSVGRRVSGRALLEVPRGEAQDDAGPGRRVETSWGRSRLGLADGRTDRTDKASWGFRGPIREGA